MGCGGGVVEEGEVALCGGEGGGGTDVGFDVCVCAVLGMDPS